MTPRTSGQPAVTATGVTTDTKKVSPTRRGNGDNRKAFEATLRELTRMGRVETVDAARVQMLRTMADTLDQRPFNAQMWKEYGEALERVTADRDDGGKLAELIASLQAPIRDPAEG
ncbi:MAG: hypothetical protein ACRDH7_09205 [Actinomycetota bacterium]